MCVLYLGSSWVRLVYFAISFTFSSQSHTGWNVLMMMNTLSVPLHTVNLQSDLIQGEVVLGVRPLLLEMDW